MNKVVLAYSGGLDTSVLVSWLKEELGLEVVTFAADVGQEEELDGLDEKAKATGAIQHYTLDLVEEFATDFIYPMFRANAIYESQYYLGTSIARPLIAKAQIEIARKEGAIAVAHGATGKGNDQCRFELTYASLSPELEIIAPWRRDDFRGKIPGRTEMKIIAGTIRSMSRPSFQTLLHNRTFYTFIRSRHSGSLVRSH